MIENFSLELNNFKKFQHIQISVHDILVISGPNNSGKSQLLYALILFFRGCNLSRNNAKRQIQTEIADLLINTAFRNLSSYSSFLNKKIDIGSSGQSTLVGNMDEKQIIVTLHANGVLELSGVSEVAFNNKIRYSFMGPSYQFEKREINRNDDIPLTSASQIFRDMYDNLSHTNQQLIISFMAELFKIENIIIIKNGRFVDRLEIIINSNTTNDEEEREIMFFGTGFQKVFVTFVLFYNLVELSEEIKFFLVEELEAFLHPSVTLLLFTILRRESTNKGVILILTSNSEQVLSTVGEENTMGLSGNIAGIERDYSSLWQSIFVSNQSPSAHEDILICDGINDQQFLRKYFQNNILANFRIIPHKSAMTTPLAISILRKGLPEEVKLIILKDLEFLTQENMNTKVQEFEKFRCESTKLLFLNVPCIESFFLIENFTKVETANDDILGCNNRRRIENYFNKSNSMDRLKQGFFDSNNVKKSSANGDNILMSNYNKIDQLLSNAKGQLNALHPNWSTVVAAMHGHTAAKEFLLKSTTELIDNVDVSHLPVFLELRDKLVAAITEISS